MRKSKCTLAEHHTLNSEKFLWTPLPSFSIETQMLLKRKHVQSKSDTFLHLDPRRVPCDLLGSAYLYIAPSILFPVCNPTYAPGTAFLV